MLDFGVAWNALGQPTSLTDANGVVNTFAYDGDGRLTSVTLAATGGAATTTIAYDGVGDIVKVTEGNGAWTSYTYDNARRVSGMTNADGDSATYTRDAMGDATAISLKSGATGAVAFSKSQAFDQLGRLIQSIGVASQTYSFGYDRTDNRTSVADPRSYVFQNGFDALSRLISHAGLSILARTSALRFNLFSCPQPLRPAPFTPLCFQHQSPSRRRDGNTSRLPLPENGRWFLFAAPNNLRDIVFFTPLLLALKLARCRADRTRRQTRV